jgi:hypothetical protein
VSARLVLLAGLWLVALTLVSLEASAHKPSDSYLTLSLAAERVDVRWDIAVRDLDYAIGVDGDGDGQVTWGELRARQSDIATLARAHLVLRADDDACSFSAGSTGGPGAVGMSVVQHSDGAYAVIRFVAACPHQPKVLDVDYQLFFDQDPQHRGVARIDDGASTRTAIFSAGERRQRFDRANVSKSRQLFDAIRQGIIHIFSGIDHLLFLIALLIPSVLRREGRTWVAVPHFRPALLDVLKVVTAFTLAHTITLSLSALGVLRLPSRLVESGIAASVILVALNNIVPAMRGDRWAAAFALGLLHGFGFSSTLMDLGLPRQNLVLTLFGFNVGVEIGQFVVVATFLPLAFLARRSIAYRKVVLIGGSIVIAAVAAVWLVERAFVVKIF